MEVVHLSAGHISEDLLTRRTSAGTAYVPPADRYAVVPDRNVNGDAPAVPEAPAPPPEAKRQKI